MFDLEPRRGGGTGRRADRRTARTLADVESVTEVREATVAGIHRVAQHAQMWSLMTALIQRRAELMAPENADSQARIALAADMASVFLITGMARKLG
jgi:hypothetical protein